MFPIKIKSKAFYSIYDDDTLVKFWFWKYLFHYQWKFSLIQKAFNKIKQFNQFCFL